MQRQRRLISHHLYTFTWETGQQNGRVAAAAAARCTREISLDIDTDKSHALRLPGRRPSVKEAAGSVSLTVPGERWSWTSAAALPSLRAGDEGGRCAGRLV